MTYIPMTHHKKKPRVDKRKVMTECKVRLLDTAPYCHYCHVSLDKDSATLDHVYPKSRGGPTHILNLVLCCGPCNATKADNVIWINRG